MAEKKDDGLGDLLDPKKLLEQLRECETKQFKNAIDLLQECEERHRRNEKKLSRLTIAASAGGALVGQEAVKEAGAIVETLDSVISGDVSAIQDVAEGAGFDPASIGLSVDENGNVVLPGGFFGGAGGLGGNGVGNLGVNPMKDNPSNDDESSEEDEEKGKEEEEEEAEEEEEEEEEEEDDEEEDDEEEEEDEEDEEEEDKEEEEPEEEEEEEPEEEEEQQEEEPEPEPEPEQDQPEPDPPSADQSASIPSLPDNTEETILQDFFEDVALAEMEQIDALVETPNLIEEIPAILRSRKPDTSEEIVRIDEGGNQPPPIIIDEEVDIIEEVIETVEVPASPIDPYIPPIAGVPIPEPGVLGVVILAAWFCAGWSFRRRRDKD
jgi:hypothetical protein